jgi:hypothetical protein
MASSWTPPINISQSAEVESHVPWDSNFYNLQYNDGRRVSTLQPLTHIANSYAGDRLMKTYYIYATGFNFRGWEFTSTNAIADRLPDFAAAFTVMNAQITRTFSSTFEMYLGGENIGNYRQDKAILGAINPFGPTFDASILYAPIFGAMYYTGLRFKIK